MTFISALVFCAFLSLETLATQSLSEVVFNLKFKGICDSSEQRQSGIYRIILTGDQLKHFMNSKSLECGCKVDTKDGEEYAIISLTNYPNSYDFTYNHKHQIGDYSLFTSQSTSYASLKKIGYDHSLWKENEKTGDGYDKGVYFQYFNARESSWPNENPILS